MPPRPRTATIRFLSLDELGRLLAATRGSARDRALFLLAYRHGLRASEVACCGPKTSTCAAPRGAPAQGQPLRHASNTGASYRDLLYVRRRYITAEQLREVVAMVTNATLRVRDPLIWAKAPMPAPSTANTSAPGTRTSPRSGTSGMAAGA